MCNYDTCKKEKLTHSNCEYHNYDFSVLVSRFICTNKRLCIDKCAPFVVFCKIGGKRTFGKMPRSAIVKKALEYKNHLLLLHECDNVPSNDRYFAAPWALYGLKRNISVALNMVSVLNIPFTVNVQNQMRYICNNKTDCCYFKYVAMRIDLKPRRQYLHIFT